MKPGTSQCYEQARRAPAPRRGMLPAAVALPVCRAVLLSRVAARAAPRIDSFFENVGVHRTRALSHLFRGVGPSLVLLGIACVFF